MSPLFCYTRCLCLTLRTRQNYTRPQPCPENSSLWPVSDRATTGTVTDRPEQGIFIRRGATRGMRNCQVNPLPADPSTL